MLLLKNCRNVKTIMSYWEYDKKGFDKNFKTKTSYFSDKTYWCLTSSVITKECTLLKDVNSSLLDPHHISRKFNILSLLTDPAAWLENLAFSHNTAVISTHLEGERKGLNEWCWPRRVVEFNKFHFSCLLKWKFDFSCWAEMKTPFQQFAEMESIRWNEFARPTLKGEDEFMVARAGQFTTQIP